MSGVALVLGILALAVLAIALAHADGEQEEIRSPLAGPDDRDLDLTAALRALGREPVR